METKETKVAMGLSQIFLGRRKPVPVSMIRAHAAHLRKLGGPLSGEIVVPEPHSAMAALHEALEELMRGLKKRIGACSVFEVKGVNDGPNKGFAVYLGPKRAVEDTNRLLLAELLPGGQIVHFWGVDPRILQSELERVSRQTIFWQEHLDAGRVGSYVAHLMDLKRLPKLAPRTRAWMGPDDIVDTIIPPDPEVVGGNVAQLRGTLSDSLAKFTSDALHPRGQVTMRRIHLVTTAGAVAGFVDLVRERLDEQLEELGERLEKKSGKARRATIEAMKDDLNALIAEAQEFERRLGVSFDGVKNAAQKMRDEQVMLLLAGFDVEEDESATG